MPERTEGSNGDGARAGEAAKHEAGAMLQELRREVQAASDRARQMLKTPAIGAAVAGAAVLAAGAVWGASEAAIAALAAYVVFRMLTKRRRAEAERDTDASDTA
jgi:hypothetical protein